MDRWTIAAVLAGSLSCACTVVAPVTTRALYCLRCAPGEETERERNDRTTKALVIGAVLDVLVVGMLVARGSEE
jgi:hypothetical protein